MPNYIHTDLNDWCARSDIDPSELLRVTNALKIDGCGWIAGGAVRRTLMNKPLDSDFDLFFSSPETMAIWIGNRKPPSLQLVRETEHHKHFRGTLPGSELPIDVQAIHFRYYDNAQQVIESFDYTICMFALDRFSESAIIDGFEVEASGDGLVQLVTTDEALWDLGRRKLAVNKITYPVASMRRMIKYTSQGFTACSGAMAALLRATEDPTVLANIDLKYVD